MKTNLSILLVFPFFFSSLCVADEISIGSQSCPVVFEDTSVSETSRSFVLGEMERFFEYAGDLRTAFNSVTTNATGFFYPMGSYSLSLPSQVQNGLLYTQIPTNLIQVKKSLSDYYLVDTNRVAQYLTAFAGVTNFLDRFNSGVITNQTIADIRTTYYLSPAITEQQMDSTIVHATETFFARQDYFLPTLLDFEIAESPLFENPIPSFRIRYRAKGNATAKVRCRPVVFIDNHWAFWME